MPSDEEVRKKRLVYMAELKRYTDQLYPEIASRLEKAFQILEPQEAKQLIKGLADVELKRVISQTTLQNEQLEARDNSAWAALFDRALAATEQLNDGVRDLIQLLDVLLKDRPKV
jgi:hypothetical protein